MTQKTYHAKLGLRGLTSEFRELNRRRDSNTDYQAADDLDHLRVSLQAAVTLEFATIPPYLCALWSIKDELHPVAKSIREIVQEEMLHMALVCNMLAALGGHPQISTAAPAYPGKLPHGVHPKLTVSLAGLNDAMLRVFMEIERPEKVSGDLARDANAELDEAQPESLRAHSKGDTTIGEFYDEILAAFERLSPSLSPDRQVTGPLAWKALLSVADVRDYIGVIKRQGEGSDSPIDSGDDDLAHFYRFAEVYKGKRLQKDPTTGKFVFGEPLPRPEVWPMASVPEGGYSQEALPSALRKHLRGFDETYSHLLDLLQSVWEYDGGQASFWQAIEVMFALQQHAKPLIQTPIDGGKGNYGPCFRYIPKSERVR